MLRARRIVCLLVLLAGAAVRAQPPMGVTESGDETAVRVWAPHARSVDLVGDFNGWNAQGSSRLAREGDSGIWSTVLKRTLPKGAYQFRINGDLPRRDPYARAVSPDGKNSLFYPPSDFAWDGDHPVEQNLEDLVIYEMHVGCFHDPRPQDGLPGTFYDALKRLDHLVDLGVSCVQLMPVHEFPGQHSWGYNPSDLFAVEQAYGGPDGLKTFVKECHRRGLAVHLDIVHNHYGPLNLDLLRFDGSGNATDGGIYFYDGAGINMTPWGPRVKFDEPMVRRFIQDNALMWLSEYHVDGFRWDSTVNIRAYDNGNRAIPAGLQMLQDINIALGEQFPGRLSIAEDSLGIGNFHASWDYDFHHSVVPVLKARNDEDRHVSSLAGALSSAPAMPRVVYAAGQRCGPLRSRKRPRPAPLRTGRPAHPDRARHPAAVHGQRNAGDRLVPRGPHPGLDQADPSRGPGGAAPRSDPAAPQPGRRRDRPQGAGRGSARAGRPAEAAGLLALARTRTGPEDGHRPQPLGATHERGGGPLPVRRSVGDPSLHRLEEVRRPGQGGSDAL